MNCIIIDKNKKTRAVIEKFVKQTPSLRLLKSCHAAHTLMNHEVHVVFLDVKMSGMNDIDFVKKVDYNHSQLIIIANTREFAKEAFDFDATDYLMQPVTQKRFLYAIAKAKRLHQTNGVSVETDDMVFIRQDGHYAKVNLDDVLYIKALGDYVSFHCTDKKYIAKQTLKRVLSKLPPERFMRTHLSYIVNVDKITAIDTRLQLVNKETIPVSRSYKKGLMERMNVL